MALILLESIDIPSSNMTCPKKVSLFNQNWHLENLAYSFFLSSLYNTWRKCDPCSSSLLEKIRISSMEMITNLFKKSLKTRCIKSINIAVVFVRPKYITKNSWCLYRVLNAVFGISSSFTFNWYYLYLKPIFENILDLASWSKRSLICGRGYLFFIVSLFSLRYSMHILNMPYFFLTKRFGASYREWLGRMRPFSNKSSNWDFSSFNSAGANREGALETSAVLGTSSMLNSICRSSGRSG